MPAYISRCLAIAASGHVCLCALAEFSPPQRNPSLRKGNKFHLDELVWQLGERPDASLLEEALRARWRHDFLPEDSVAETPVEDDRSKSRGELSRKRRLEAKRRDEEHRRFVEESKRRAEEERLSLDEQIDRLRGEVEAGSFAAELALVACLSNRGAQRDHAEVSKYVPIITTKMRQLQPDQTLDVWESLPAVFWPQWDFAGRAEAHPRLRPIASQLVNAVESQAGTRAGPDCLRLANCLSRCASWRWAEYSVFRAEYQVAVKSQRRQAGPPREPLPPGHRLWLEEFERAIEADVPGAWEGLVAAIGVNSQSLSDTTFEQLLDRVRSTYDGCAIWLRERLCARYLAKRESSLDQLKAAGLIEEFLAMPHWTPYHSNDPSIREIGGREPSKYFPRDVWTRIQARTSSYLASGTGKHARDLALYSRARSGDVAACLEVASVCDPSLHPVECIPSSLVHGSDTEYALLWRLLAACNGSPEGALAVAQMAESGHGLAASRRTALRWYIVAAQGGNEPAIQKVFSGLKSGDKCWLDAGLSLVPWLAEKGDPDAMLHLGQHILASASAGDSEGVAKGVHLLAKAADAGMVAAASALAAHYRALGDVEDAPAQALKWRERAAKLGDAAAMLDWLNCLDLDAANAEQVQAALLYARRLLEQKFAAAEAAAVRLAERCDARSDSRSGVLEIRRLLANLGHWTSMVWMADCSLDGLRLPRDEAGAYYWLTLAVTRAPENQRVKLAQRRDDLGSTLDPSLRGEAERRCRDYQPVFGMPTVAPAVAP